MSVKTIIRGNGVVQPSLPEFQVLTYTIPADGSTTAAVIVRTTDPSVDFWVNGKLSNVPVTNGVAQLDVGTDTPQALTIQARTYSAVINAVAPTS